MTHTVYNKFNRGEIDDNAIARDDVKKVNNSAALMRNFWPQRLGPMSYRPGTEYKDTFLTNETRLTPFVKKIDDLAILAFSNNELRFVVDDQIVTRTAVGSTINNPYFNTNLTGWTNDDGIGSSSVWATGGYASLTGTDTTSAVLYQTITTTAIEHGLRIVIKEAPARVRIGTAGAYSTDILDATLGVGTHALAFTPSSNITITLSNSNKYRTLIDSVEFEAAGTLILPTDITTADLPNIKTYQSADVMFLAVEGKSQKVIERRGIKSWSIVDYRADDGPFGTINVTDVTLTAAATSGNTTLTSSEPIFASTDVGALYKLASAGQTVDASVSAADAGTGSIRVTGVSGTRIFSVNVSGTFVATVTLQRSADDVLWEDVETYTGTTSKTYDDGLDNAVLYYRLYVKPGDYTSGTAILQLDYESGSIEGIARVTGYTSSTVVDVQILESFGNTDSTLDWYKGSWNGTDGYPTAVTVYEGRVFWAGSNTIWGSVSDAYYSFNGDTEGASAPITRTIGIGPVDSINWICPTSRLIIGMPMEDLSLRSSSFGEVLTNTNANIKDNSGQGSSPVDYAKAGQSIYFAHHVTTKLIRLMYDANSDAHTDEDLMTMHPSIASAGIKRIAIVRQPETRVFVVLDDGTAAVFLHDRSEEVGAWAQMTADASIEDVIMLPGTTEDRVYFVMKHDTRYYLEKLSLFSETRPHDSHVRYTSPGTTLTGLSRFNGRTIGVWADGEDLGDFEVVSGSVTIPAGKVNVTAGLRYTADYTSNKLTQYVPYSVLTRRARVVDVALIASDLYAAGLSIGPDSANLKNIEGAVNGDYDQDSFPFDGSYNTDSRAHVRATAPCTVKALVYGIRESKNKGTNEG